MAVGLILLHPELKAQNTRINTYEQIGWYNYFGTYGVGKKISLHTEYQWRRADYLLESQQGLLRLGFNYQINPRLLLRLGYGNIETYAYGDIPIQSLGLNFSEHRAFGILQMSDKMGAVNISHRWMMEQRWIENYQVLGSDIQSVFKRTNRMRYMLRLSAPIGTKNKNNFYWAVYDEIFIGWGKNVQNNIFDQNRLGILIGKNISSNIKLEMGYLNQIVQFGRRIGNNNIFQYNNGIIVNFQLDYKLKNSKEQKRS